MVLQNDLGDKPKIMWNSHISSSCSEVGGPTGSMFSLSSGPYSDGHVECSAGEKGTGQSDPQSTWPLPKKAFSSCYLAVVSQSEFSNTSGNGGAVRQMPQRDLSEVLQALEIVQNSEALASAQGAGEESWFPSPTRARGLQGTRSASEPQWQHPPQGTLGGAVLSMVGVCSSLP